MRKVLFPVVLLRAVAAFAQPIISNEISADVAQRLSASTAPAVAMAMARDRQGIAIAWTMIDSEVVEHVSFVRLDATGHFIGAIRVLPMSSIGPSLAAAPGGEGFVLAFVEKMPAPAAAYCMLDRALNPSPAVVLPTTNVSLLSPPIVRSGSTTWITADTSVWQIANDGSLRGPLNGGMNVTDMAIANDVPQLVSGHAATDTFKCRPDPGCITQAGPFRGFCNESCRIYDSVYTLQFTSLFTASSSKTLPFWSNDRPGIGSDGRDVLIAWFDHPPATSGSAIFTRLAPEAFGDFARAMDQSGVLGTSVGSLSSRPDIASDGERYVVVWHTVSPLSGYHIAGASIDRAGNVTPFSFSSPSEEERYPSVVATGRGTFLVAYEAMTGAGRRIAGRFVTFPARSRAVR